jgi:hypothetical protein
MNTVDDVDDTGLKPRLHSMHSLLHGNSTPRASNAIPRAIWMLGIILAARKVPRMDIDWSNDPIASWHWSKPVPVILSRLTLSSLLQWSGPSGRGTPGSWNGTEQEIEIELAKMVTNAFRTTRNHVYGVTAGGSGPHANSSDTAGECLRTIGDATYVTYVVLLNTP